MQLSASCVLAGCGLSLPVPGAKRSSWSDGTEIQGQPWRPLPLASLWDSWQRPGSYVIPATHSHLTWACPVTIWYREAPHTAHTLSTWGLGFVSTEALGWEGALLGESRRQPGVLLVPLAAGLASLPQS